MELKPDTPSAAFEAQADNYELVDDFFTGVGAVRAKGVKYLPKTPSMLVKEGEQLAKKGAGLIAQTRYEAYLSRAAYPGILRHTISAMAGMTASKPPKTLQIPASWADIERCATRNGENLRRLHMMLVREQAKKGRVGLVVDIRGDEPVPVFEPFWADQIINWRQAVIQGKGKRVLTLLVLKTNEIREGDEFWESQSVPVVILYELTGAGVVLRKFEKVKQKNGDAKWQEMENVEQPRRARAGQANTEQIRAGDTISFRLDEIPFTPITPDGLLIEPKAPPFIDLAHKLRDIYIASANYREALSMYEPTPFARGYTAEEIEEGYIPKTMGVGTFLAFPEHIEEVGMLEYKGETIKDIRQALMDDAAEAEKLAAQPFERISAQVESGESRQERAKAKSNLIREMHLSAAAGVQESMRKAARWLGENPDNIIYEVDDDLEMPAIEPGELKELRETWLSGLISDQDAWANLKRGGVTEMEFEEWRAAREGGETGALLDA